MLKIIGSLIVIFSSTGIGLKLCSKLYQQNNELMSIKKSIIYLRGEIEYNITNLSDALYDISDKIAEPLGSTYRIIAHEIQEKPDKTLGEIWKQNILNNFRPCILNVNQIERFSDFGKSLGFLDKSMQVNNINLFLIYLDDEINENLTKQKTNCKLYKYLGFMGGLLFVLIFI